MGKLIVSAILAGAVAGAAMGYARAQLTPKKTVVVIYYTTPLEKDLSRVVRLQSVTFPPGGGNKFHRHPGDQWSTVQEGEITFTIKGQSPRVLKVGDSAHIPRGTIHRNQNLGAAPAKIIELVVIDKDKPFFELVPE